MVGKKRTKNKLVLMDKVVPGSIINAPVWVDPLESISSCNACRIYEWYISERFELSRLSLNMFSRKLKAEEETNCCSIEIGIRITSQVMLHLLKSSILGFWVSISWGRLSFQTPSHMATVGGSKKWPLPLYLQIHNMLNTYLWRKKW